MSENSLHHLVAVVISATCLVWSSSSDAAQLTVRLENALGVKSVGAICRWDLDGNPTDPVNPKAKIDEPRVDASARHTAEDNWVFENLPAERYDLVILADAKLRVEGFHYPPLLEFDPVLLHRDQVPKKDVAWVTRHIAQSRHYENKVTPLYFGGDEKQIRVFVQLLRDEPTSYDGQFGEQVATLRHEVWQYTNHYGGWAKEQRTKVFDRILMAKRLLRGWTWVWVPELGGLQIADGPVEVSFRIPDQSKLSELRGLIPY